ncbi:hypothetical protein CAPTEDRAFT_189745 [Capitella teleta]|uniref:Uncharacterized protein n=1 Tax=Capitella teleta TaxID=283909 RepID=R7U293_CAPTE|nr:hypothetical protein CAPTEDRAFT_189745 [Capitella teleta]|eukprot:ELU00120.1 hypothetical protein CAPTEDRAFT_189745 [Capitella teleta]
MAFSVVVMVQLLLIICAKAYPVPQTAEQQLKILEELLNMEPNKNSVMNEKGFDFEAIGKLDKLHKPTEDKRMPWMSFKNKQEEKRVPWMSFKGKQEEKRMPWMSFKGKQEEKRLPWMSFEKENTKRVPWFTFKAKEQDKRMPWMNFGEEWENTKPGFHSWGVMLEHSDDSKTPNSVNNKQSSAKWDREPRMKLLKRPFGSGSHHWGEKSWRSSEQAKIREEKSVEKRPFGNAVYQG